MRRIDESSHRGEIKRKKKGDYDLEYLEKMKMGL